MKRIFRNVLTYLLAIVMTVGSAPLTGLVGLEMPDWFNFSNLFSVEAEAATYSGTCGNNVDWSLDTSAGVLVIDGIGEMKSYSLYGKAPWHNYYKDVKTVEVRGIVTNIGSHAFYGCINLTEITLPDSIKSIGSSSFDNCGALTSIAIPANVTSIGACAFYGCESLTGITIPAGVTFIGENAFKGCKSITSINIPSGVTKIQTGLFEGCTSLESITVSNSNANYSSDSNGVLFDKNKTVLVRCPSDIPKTRLTLPGSVTTINEYAFSDCKNITSIAIPDGVTSFGYSAFRNCAALAEIKIPVGVTKLGSSVFEGCRSVTSIDVPDTVTSMGSNTFRDCSSLKTVTIGKGVPSGSVEYDTFMGCSSLESITVSEGNSSYSSDSYGVLFNKDKTELIRFPAGSKQTSYKIPADVTSVDRYAFECSVHLVEATIGSSVKTIGESAFVGCTGLSTVKISNKVESIGSNAFEKCSSLQSVSIPAGLTSISNSLFFDCTGLTDVKIGDNIETIEGNAFQNCSGLKNITIPDSVTSLGYGVFAGCKSLIHIIIPDSITSIENGLFYGCTALEYVHIPAGVSSIANSVFSYNSTAYICSTSDDCYPKTYATKKNIEYRLCGEFDEKDAVYSGKCGENLTWVMNATTGELKILGAGDMYNYGVSEDVPWYAAASYIRTVMIGDSVTGICDQAFNGCEKLTSITIPKRVKNISAAAFYNCIGLANITVSDDNQNYSDSDGVLFNKDKTRIVYFPAGNTKTSYKIPDGVTAIEDYAFYGCTGLESITIPDGVMFISQSAFFGCTGLESISLSDTVSSIGDHAFSGCSGLSYISLPDSVVTIGKYAFRNCTGLKNIIIPDSVTFLGDYLFDGCSNLVSVHVSPKVKAVESNFMRGTPAYLCSSEIGFVKISDSMYSSKVEYGTLKSAVENQNQKFVACTNHVQNDSVKTGECGYKAYDIFTWMVNTDKGTLTVCGNDMRDRDNSAWNQYNSVIKTVIVCSDVYLGLGNLSDCENLQKIIVDEKNKHMSSDNDGILYNKDKTKIIQYPIGAERTNYTVPDGVTTIDRYAFKNCDSLECVIIPDGATYIYYNAFENCTNLKSVHIPSSVTDIDDYILYNTTAYICSDSEDCDARSYAVSNEIEFRLCEGHSEREKNNECGDDLTWSFDQETGELVIDGMGNEIDSSASDYAPWDDSSDDIKTVIIPLSVKTIGDDMFSRCNGITDVYYAGGSKDWEKIEIGSGNENLEQADIHYAFYYVSWIVGDKTTENKVEIGNKIFAPTDPEKSGYIFTGWGSEIPAEMPEKDLTFTAQFEPVTYNADFVVDGKIIASVPYTVEIKVLEEPVIPQKAGYTGTWEEYELVSGGITVNARYTVNSYTVIWNVDGKETIEIYKYGATIVQPAEPSKDGYEFKGWTPSVQSSMPAYNLKFTAVFEEIVDEFLFKATCTYCGAVFTNEISYNNHIAEHKEEKPPYDFTVLIRKPSTTTISYGDSIILHADMNEALPSGWTVKWTADNGNFSYSENGETCTISPNKSGDTTFTATVYDENGNEISKDNQTMKSKAGFFDKFAAFFRKLFGMTKIIQQSINF